MVIVLEEGLAVRSGKRGRYDFSLERKSAHVAFI